MEQLGWFVHCGLFKSLAIHRIPHPYEIEGLRWNLCFLPCFFSTGWGVLVAILITRKGASNILKFDEHMLSWFSLYFSAPDISGRMYQNPHESPTATPQKSHGWSSGNTAALFNITHVSYTLWVFVWSGFQLKNMKSTWVHM